MAALESAASRVRAGPYAGAVTGEPQGGTRERPRLDGRVWWFAGGYGLSAAGTGATFPFLSIYFRQALGLSSAVSALALLLLAGTAIPASVVGGRLCDLRSPSTIAMTGLVVQALGWSVLVVLRDAGSVLSMVTVIGVGTGLFLPAIAPMLDALTATPAQRSRAFSVRYLVMNVGLGAGAAFAALVLHTPSLGAYSWLFAIDAASCVLYALLVALKVRVPAQVRHLPDGGTPVLGEHGRRGQTPSWRNLNFGLLLVIQLLICMFGMSQIESGVPLLLRTRLGISPTIIGLLYALGTVVVVAGQLPVSRFVERVHKTRALAGLSATWALSWMLGVLATHAPIGDRVPLLIAMIVVFTIGECAYSPAFYGLLALLSPQGSLGSHGGLTWATYNVGGMIGPPLAVLIVSAAPADTLWIVMAAAAVCTGATAAALDYRMHRTHRIAVPTHRPLPAT